MLELTPSWAECVALVQDMCDRLIRHTLDGSGRSVAIMAVNRGGLVPGVMISNLLGLPLYPVDSKVGLCRLPVLENHLVLLVDDICHSGDTMTHLHNYVEDQLSGNSVISMTLFYKDNSNYLPSIFGREVAPDAWVHLPWEREAMYQQNE